MLEQDSFIILSNMAECGKLKDRKKWVHEKSLVSLQFKNVIIRKVQQEQGGCVSSH